MSDDKTKYEFSVVTDKNDNPVIIRINTETGEVAASHERSARHTPQFEKETIVQKLRAFRNRIKRKRRYRLPSTEEKEAVFEAVRNRIKRKRRYRLPLTEEEAVLELLEGSKYEVRLLPTKKMCSYLQIFMNTETGEAFYYNPSDNHRIKCEWTKLRADAGSEGQATP